MEIFELAGGTKIEGERVDTKDKFSFNCFIAKTDSSYGLYVLFDEMTGLEIGYIREDKEESLKAIAELLRRKNDIEAINSIHNREVEQGNILPKFSKNIMMTYLFPKTNIKFKRTEYIEKFVNEFKLNRYFNSIFHHTPLNNFAQNDTCYVFCNGIQCPTGIKCEEIFVDIDPTKLPFKDVFDFFYPKPKGTISKTKMYYTTILEKRFNIGYYIPDMNTLFLSDIPHSDDFSWMKDWFNNFIMRELKPKFNGTQDMVVTIGSDPEFELHYNGINKCGKELQTQNRLYSKIGTDGCGRQMELRPDPRTSPEEAVEEIERLLDTISYHTLRCDGEQEALGGHLHFGIKKDGMSGVLTASDDMIKALDLFVGKPTSLLSGNQRKNTEYGRIHDYRPQPWGFEYRTPPAGIFCTKQMAYITFKIAYNVVSKLIKEGKIVTSLTPAYEEYRDICNLTKEEYEYFINFPKMYKNLKDKSFVSNWVNPKENPIKITFYDTWDEGVKEYIYNNIKSAVATRPIHFCFYGLMDSRGPRAVAGLPLLRRAVDCKTIQHPKDSHCDEGISIGLGSMFRKTMNNNNLMYICDEIRSKIGIVNDTTGPVNTLYLFPDEMLPKSDKPNIEIGGKEIE